MLRHVGAAVLKRAIQGDHSHGGHGDDDFPQYDVPAWSYIIFLVNLILFIPLNLYVQYTVGKVFPVFAMVEDENPPAYEPVALDDEFAGEESTRQNPPKPIAGDSKAVSSSIRGMHRMLRANGGFRALFRGFFCLLAQKMMTGVLQGIFMASLGSMAAPVATLLAALTLVQFSTAWVHIVLTKRSMLHFWQRLPPFKRTFNATWKPVVLYWAVSELAEWMPLLLAGLIGLEIPNIELEQPTRVPAPDGSNITKLLVVLIVGVMSSIFMVIPARVILHRIQASLLPVDADTIIPFDRTFEGRVESVIVSGKGYATIQDAWATFSKAAWRRLVVLYVKIGMVFLGAIFLMMAIAIPEGILIFMFSSKTSSSGDL
jgi:hypothetical protein